MIFLWQTIFFGSDTTQYLFATIIYNLSIIFMTLNKYHYCLTRAHVLLSTDSIRAHHSALVTLTILGTPVTCARTPFLAQFGVLTPSSLTVWSYVFTTGIGNRTRTSLVLRGSVGCGSVRVAVTHSSFREDRVVGPIEQTTVVVSSGKLDESVISPPGTRKRSDLVNNQSELVI